MVIFASIKYEVRIREEEHVLYSPQFLFILTPEVCIRVPQRNKTDRMCTYRERDLLQGTSSWGWRPAGPPPAGWAGSLEAPEGRGTEEVQRRLLENSLLLEGQAFCSTQAPNRMGEVHSHYRGKSVYLKVTDRKVNLTQNTQAAHRIKFPLLLAF